MRQAFKSPIRIGMCPDMASDKRHATVIFDVVGLGRVRRDIVVDEPDKFFDNVPRLAPGVFSQMLLLDPTLPESIKVCKPKLLDVVGRQCRRIYDVQSWAVVFEQHLP